MIRSACIPHSSPRHSPICSGQILSHVFHVGFPQVEAGNGQVGRDVNTLGVRPRGWDCLKESGT